MNNENPNIGPDQMEEHFRKTFEHFAPEPPQVIWDKIEATFPADSAKSWYTSAKGIVYLATGAVVLSTLAYYLWPQPAANPAPPPVRNDSAITPKNTSSYLQSFSSDSNNNIASEAPAPAVYNKQKKELTENTSEQPGKQEDKFLNSYGSKNADTLTEMMKEYSDETLPIPKLEPEPEKKAPVKTNFYEKKIKAVKDSLRPLFVPEK